VRGKGRILKSAASAALALAAFLPGGAQALSLKPGDLVVSFSEPPVTIAKVKPRTGALTPIASGDHLKAPWQLTVTPNGRIVVADYQDKSILSIDPRNGAQTVVSSGPTFKPVGLAWGANGKLIVSDYDDGAILSVDPRTGARTTLASDPSLVQAAELAVTPNGRVFVATENNTFGGAYAIAPRTHAVRPLATVAATEMENPYGLTLSATGKVLVADYDAVLPDAFGAVFSIPPSGGTPRLFSSGQLFGNGPIGIARSFQGPLFVTDTTSPDGDGSVISVNPRSGHQRRVALASASGLSFPDGVAVVPPRCFGKFATIVGSPRSEKLKGTRFADVISGVAGKDRIIGRGGRDRICGGKGDDSLIGGKARDRLKGGPGADLTRQ